MLNLKYYNNWNNFGFSKKYKFTKNEKLQKIKNCKIVKLAKNESGYLILDNY